MRRNRGAAGALRDLCRRGDLCSPCPWFIVSSGVFSRGGASVGKEKRRGPRGPVSATAVLLRGEQHLGSFRVLNLSAGGALLVGRPPDGPAEELDVLVRLSTGRTVRAPASIVREDSVDEASVFALAFGMIAKDDHEAIHNVVLTALEDARDATALIVAGAPEAWHLLR